MGAPKDNVTIGAAAKFDNPGALYRCDITTLTTDCKQVPLIQSREQLP